MSFLNEEVCTDNEIICKAIVEKLLDIQSPTKEELNRIKLAVCRKFHTTIIKDSEILSFLKAQNQIETMRSLRSKPTRMISGVNVVAVMTSPSKCPHGRCAYCPGGPEYNVPQSYTGHEPAAMRGTQNEFDAFSQVKNRMEQLRVIGHDVSKVELIVMGGTFPARDMSYQTSFVKGCLDAINGVNSPSFEETKRKAEESKVRNVGITFETRPDYCKESHVDRMLELGVTRVELGVQTIYDDVYRLIERGHTLQDVIHATRVAKNAGLKVCYHMMLGLPNSSLERDLEAFKTLFTNQNYMPDMLKIYPCLVLRSAKIYDWWKEGKYKPYTVEEATDLIVEIKKILPVWVRVMRIQRDIPAKLIVAGVKKGNLRQLVWQEMKKRDLKCPCIRCNEVGHRRFFDDVTPKVENIQMVKRSYKASNGEEIFISAEDKENKVIIGYLRLRFPSPETYRSEINFENTSIIRELHIYGPLVPLGEATGGAWQHKGYGKMLLEEGERISLEKGRTRVVVNSALGVREYFRLLGYHSLDPYMEKDLPNPNLHC